MNRKIADDAVTLGKWITACCAMTLAFMALGYLALVGDEIRQERIEAAKPAVRSEWADHPNDSHCGWSCIDRIGDGRE
jgi:hypothetical protein